MSAGAIFLAVVGTLAAGFAAALLVAALGDNGRMWPERVAGIALFLVYGVIATFAFGGLTVRSGE